VSGLTLELLDLVARWIHVIAGIMWIGNSLLFNWVDRSLDPPRGTAQTRAPLGTIWLLHSGGFYYVEKTLLEGETLPQPMHWFKWQAYTTWWSGVALLVVVYWAGGRAVMADPSVANLTQTQATLVGIAAIVAGWALYETMQRFVAPRARTLAAVIWIAGLGAIAMSLTQLLSGRAAFLHVGAMLGTIMAGNVVLTIVPSQRILEQTVSEGKGGDPAVSARAKRVSIHNNYFTFPVIVLMVSNHFPAIYGSRLNWALMLALVIAGATVRHVLNIRWKFAAWRPTLAATIAASVIVLYALMRFGSENVASAAASAAIPSGPVTFADVRHIVDRRCAVCHSERPTDQAFGAVPAGVYFDTPEQIAARAARINVRAVVTRTMPPANKTHITDAERAILGRWIADGAQFR
jgi:uncharacterized membrane protein